LNPGDNLAKQRFQEVSEAYSVLKDNSKRRQYDRMGASSYQSPQGSGGGAQYNTEYQDPFDLFREVFDEFGIKDIESYATNVRDEATQALTQAKAGNYDGLWNFAKKRKGLIFSIVVPTFLILRFPGLVIAAVRGLMLGAVAALQHPIVRRAILNYMYNRFIRSGRDRRPRY